MLGSLPSPARLVSLGGVDPRARCLDGSPAVYYISEGANRSAFVFHHQGGGWCQTLDECQSRAKGRLGSSRSYPHSMDLRSVDAPPTASPTTIEMANFHKM